ncbi:hypothetical protein UFOVP535_38 [uncultured Caudovirales phage]|uniref:Uncharacterized protein n=1 Tax=uncultured Caudovirales phage TaxID=2100421 RepID=A0A6J5MQD7_9CAUD|nr:hypothetical protein UFOVP535_38 [uncultured Caudovirales phage]
MLKYLLLLIIIVGCNPSRKLDKLCHKNPQICANYCKDNLPCVTTKIDTVTRVEYDFIEIQCPGVENVKIDTIRVTNTKTIKGPAVLVTQQQYNTITKTIKDSAAIRSCELEVIALNEKCKEITSQNVKLQNKVTAKNRWIMWLIIALLCSILCNVIQLKK